MGVGSFTKGLIFQEGEAGSQPQSHVTIFPRPGSDARDPGNGLACEPFPVGPTV